MKRGFTLVELAIVLVIIGLLIGGIIAAQSMMQTAKNNSVVRQIQQYDIAAGNFKATYKNLPGDSPLFSPAGNGDGTLSTSCSNAWPAFPEQSNFFVHLYQAGFSPNGVTFYAPTVATTVYDITPPNIHVPVLQAYNDINVLPTTGACPYYINPSNDTYVFDNQKNHWWLAALNNRDSGTWHYRAMTGNVAYAIDLKMDDGKPLMGNVRGTRDDGTNGVGSPGAAYCIVDKNSLSTSYNTSRSTKECELSVLMLSAVGQ